MPKESDYFNNGNFDIGPGAPSALTNCVAYKLCYYRFDKLQTEYGKPPGYDRARHREVRDRRFAFMSCHGVAHCVGPGLCLGLGVAVLLAPIDIAQVGRKNIVLSTMEEAFTSEHWIVRIYKVKKR